MKVLVEALCAEFGGIRTYVEHLLRAWGERFPDDEVHVLVRAGSTLPVPVGVSRHEISVPRLGPLGRPLAQTRSVSQFVRSLGPDAVVATLPSTTVRRPSVPTAVVVYDLRHELRPHQFSRSTRLLRAVSYRLGYAIADGYVSISQRTLDDLHTRHPRTARRPAVVAHLGADHVDRWRSGSRTGPAITFAHHTNKNLDLILDAWSLLGPQEAPPLQILGLGAARRDELRPRIQEAGLEGLVTMAPFLPEKEFQTAFAQARMIVFPSDFEGFGLPIAEAMRLGIPVVIGLDPATLEVASGHAASMTSWSPNALADAVTRAAAKSETELAAAREFANRYTWAATVAITRDLLVDLVSGTRTPIPKEKRS